MTIRRLAHICLHVKDLQKAVEFYRDGLGLTKKFDFLHTNGSPVGCYMEVGDGTFVEMFENKELVPKEGNILHMCMEVDDINGLAKELEQRGIEHTAVALGADQSYQLWVSDPDGNKTEFHEYTDKSSQLVGGNPVVDW